MKLHGTLRKRYRKTRKEVRASAPNRGVEKEARDMRDSLEGLGVRAAMG